MITIFDTKTRTKHNLDGLGGPTPVLLIKDHVQHLTEHQLEHHQLVLDAKVLTDECTVDADLNKLIYVIPILKNDQPQVTDDHVSTLHNLIAQMQTNDKAIGFLEMNLDAKTIPSTLIAVLLSSKCRQSLLSKSLATKFLQSNTCVLKFLETLKSKPGVMSAHQQDIESMLSGMGYPHPGPNNGPRTGPNMGAGLRQGGPQSRMITPEFLQQALSGAMQRTGLANNNIPNHVNGETQQGGAQNGQNALLSQLLGYQPQPGGAPAPTGPAAAPMEGVEEGAGAIRDQMISRAEQLEQLHAMGLMDDLQNIQALQATNGNVEAAIELLFSDME